MPGLSNATHRRRQDAARQQPVWLLITMPRADDCVMHITEESVEQTFSSPCRFLLECRYGDLTDESRRYVLWFS